MKTNKILLLGLILTLVVFTTGSELVASYIIIDPGGGGSTPLAWVSTPSDTSVTAGTSVSRTWKAKSSYSGRGYVLKKNGVQVQTGSWSSYSAITYTYTPSVAGVDDLYMKVYDSISALYDHCYVTVTAPDADGDGVTDARELLLGTDPNDPNDPLGQHFEDQSVGQNPNGWSILEYSGYSDVRIVESTTLGLVNPNTGRLLKITQMQYGAAPMVYKPVNYDLHNPLLISFEAGLYSQYNDWSDDGYLEMYCNNGQQLTFQLKYDRVCIWEGTTYCKNVDLDFNEKQMYKYNIILQTDSNGYLDYSIYIDGANYAYGQIGQADELLYLTFGSESYCYTEFYVDNIYIDNVQLTNIQYNIPVHQAIPLCWLFAPEVYGVMSAYHVGDTTSVEIDIKLKLGGSLGKYVEVELGVSILNWYEELTDNYYGVMLDNNCPDVIMHIRYEYYISKMSIILPGTSEVYMDVLIDCNYAGSKYYYLSADDFLIQYGWVPDNPRNSGVTKIDSHTKTYEQTYGFVMEYKDNNGQQTMSVGAGVSVGLGLMIGAEITYSEAVYAETYLWVNCAVQPFFDYGRPNSYYAYLGIQPYIVKALNTM
ncbi:MAG: hypothetical protein FK734_03480 [Asgard group archaeon]|nr:hypothetical protein [Asgard group archaeon]